MKKFSRKVNFISFIFQLITGVLMARKKNRKMPSGFAGLTRYFDESPEKIKLRPEQVIILASSVIVIVGLLKVFAG